MISLDTALLRGWRSLAFLGHYSGLDALADRGTNRVLRYHSVGGGVYDDIPPSYFRQQIEYLDAHYDLVDLPEVLRPGSPKRIAITFDDGYRDFYENVRPILREYEVPATVFVIADAFDDVEFSHTDDYGAEYMDLAQVRDLVDDDLVTVGNHTLSHAELPTLSDSRLHEEIVGAKERLEELLGTDVTRFAYPYNSFDSRAADLVRRTHEVGVVSRGRFEPVSPATDPATIPRINGPNPLYELCWDLSDAATHVGSVGADVFGLRQS